MEISWKSLADVKIKYVGVETNPKFITIVTSVESVIKIEIRVTIEEFDGKIILCIPYSTLEPIKEKLYSNVHSEAVESDKQCSQCHGKRQEHQNNPGKIVCRKQYGLH